MVDPGLDSTSQYPYAAVKRSTPRRSPNVRAFPVEVDVHRGSDDITPLSPWGRHPSPIWSIKSPTTPATPATVGACPVPALHVSSGDSARILSRLHRAVERR